MSQENNSLLLIEAEYNKLVSHYAEAIKSRNEVEANDYWLRIQVYEINKDFLSMYNCLKSNQFYNAWCLLGKIEIKINHVEKNFDLNGLINLKLIKNMVPNYMSLFPYKWFLSREMVVEKVKCSICDKEIKPRSRCEHKKGKLYMGKLCANVITKARLVGVGLVTNPADYYGVVYSKNVDEEYDYTILKKLISELKSPFIFFTVNK